MSLIVKIPEFCKDCQFFRKELVDHNYYGEETTKLHCALFRSELTEGQKCEGCKDVFSN